MTTATPVQNRNNHSKTTNREVEKSHRSQAGTEPASLAMAANVLTTTLPRSDDLRLPNEQVVLNTTSIHSIVNKSS